MLHGPTGRVDMPMVSPTLTATRTTAWTIAEYVDTGASGVEADYSPKGRYSIAKQAASSRALRANKLFALPLLSGLGGCRSWWQTSVKVEVAQEEGSVELASGVKHPCTSGGSPI